MTRRRRSFSRAYAGLVGAAFAAAGAIALLGYWPTMRLSGDAGVAAMLAGCGVSWVASCVGAIPLAVAWTGKSQNASMAILGATAVRMFVALLLAAALVLSDWFDRRILVLWIAVSYLLTLAVDTLVAVRMTRRVFETD